MAATREILDVREFLTTDEIPLERLHEVRREVHCHVDHRNQVESLIADFASIAKKFSSENKAEVRKGVALWLVGRSEDGAKVLQSARSSKEKAYIAGLCLLEAGRAAEAVEALKEAHDADGADPLVSAAYCEARIVAGRFEEAESHVEKLLKKETAEAHYLKGLLADRQGFHERAQEGYEKALELDPAHAKALFRMAYIFDLRGEDSKAMELYEQLRKLRPMHLSTVMNLGVMYEDRGEFERAVQCYQSVLDYFPNHGRARLYLHDAQSSMTMFYDEDAARREAKLQQLLGQPVAEVSFSPRVRGALQKLGLNTIGEVVAKSEEEFLGIANFGRTSLRELKEFLSSKGLTLAVGGTPGGLLEAPEGEAAGVEPVAAGAEVLQKNLSDFEWSGRIRKVFEKLGLVTVGDLMSRTEKDLLKSKNLGVTSIKEVRKKLGQLGLAMNAE